MHLSAKQKRLICAAALVGALAAMTLLLSMITLYSDDYQYACFFRGGAASFWQKTVNHYLNSNGRALIHFLDQLFLLCGTRLYALTFPLLLALIFALGLAFQADRLPLDRTLSGVALSLVLTLALPVQYLNQTLLWVTGSFNYCFPLLPVLAYLFLLRRYAERAEGSPGLAAACGVLGFLAGATTEQSGCMALLGGGLILLCALLSARRRGTPPPRSGAWVSLGLTLGGYLTVLLAPGTSGRIQADARGGLLAVLASPSVFFEHFRSVMHFFCGRARAFPLVLALMLVLSCLPLLRQGKTKRGLSDRLLPLGFPCIAAHALALATGHELTAELFAFGYLFLAALSLLFDDELRMTGILLLCALASIGIMIFTDIAAYRTVMPTLLMCITVLVRLLFLCLPALPRKWMRIGGTAALCLLCAVAAYPTFRGYRQNYAVASRNEAAIEAGRTSGEIVLDTDYLDTYRHTLMFEGSYFYTYFKLCYRIPDDCTIYFEGEHFAHYPVTLDGTPLPHHAMMTGGILYLPLDELAAAVGASLSWDFAANVGFYIGWQGEEYYLSLDDACIYRLRDGTVAVPACYTITPTDLSYIDLASAAQLFALTDHFDFVTLALTRKQ